MSDFPQTREAVLLAIVDRIGMAEGKAMPHTSNPTTFISGKADRAWFTETFNFARKCLGDVQP
jgi:hypothetical protein